MQDNFKIILLIGRPAAGKSEVIDYLKKTPIEERSEKFHINDFFEIDDFPYIWDWFEEDDFLAKHGKKRLHTDDNLYFTDNFFWNVCIEKINLAFNKKLRDDEKLLENNTAIIEFARGGENGFAEAFSYLSDEILEHAAIVYIDVSYEESVRKNQRRSRKGLEDTILFHSLPDEKMEFYYKANDWKKIAPNEQGTIDIKGHKVPYAILPNEPEVTNDPAKLGPALLKTLSKLWQLVSKK